MTSQRGNPRFKAAGSQWKTAWQRRQAYTEMCWFQGFSDTLLGNYYEDPGGVLPLVPGDGFFIGAVVGIGASPAGISGFEYIAHNGGAADEGWDLIVNDAGTGPDGEPLVTFTFRVYDGAGITALATVPAVTPFTVSLDPQAGVDREIFRVFGWFEAPGGAVTDGAINLWVEGQVALLANIPLAAPYVNSTPLLQVGNGLIAANALEAPNCLHGLVGGDGIPNATTVGSMQAVLDGVPVDNFVGWAGDILDELQIVSPVGSIYVPTLNPTNGWRANNPFLGPGPAPNPLLPFLGATNLVYANASPPAAALTVDCAQPSVFENQALGA